MAVVVVTHEMESVKVIADRILMLVPRAGGAKVAFRGTYDEMTRSEDPEVRDFVERAPIQGREPRPARSSSSSWARTSAKPAMADTYVARLDPTAGRRLKDDLGRDALRLPTAGPRVVERAGSGHGRHPLPLGEARGAGAGRRGLRDQVPRSGRRAEGRREHRADRSGPEARRDRQRRVGQGRLLRAADRRGRPRRPVDRGGVAGARRAGLQGRDRRPRPARRGRDRRHGAPRRPGAAAGGLQRGLRGRGKPQPPAGAAPRRGHRGGGGRGA